MLFLLLFLLLYHHHDYELAVGSEWEIRNDCEVPVLRRLEIWNCVLFRWEKLEEQVFTVAGIHVI